MIPPTVLAAGASRSGGPLQIFGDVVTIKVSSADTDRKFTVVHCFTPPKSGPPLHRHLKDGEWFYIESGRFLFVHDGERSEHGPGETLYVAPGVAHQYQNIGDTPGVLIVVVSPGGLDEFFIELDALLKDPATFVGGSPDMAALAALHAKYEMEFLGPPLD